MELDMELERTHISSVSIDPLTPRDHLMAGTIHDEMVYSPLTILSTSRP